jgi:nucleoside-diphosphate-sugar epimerase
LAGNLSLLAGRHVLVTGANGFLGRNLIGALLNADAKVIAVVRKQSKAWRLADVSGEISLVECDLGQRRQLKKLSELSELCGVRFVFHLAAGGVDGSQGDPNALIADNVIATGNLLEDVRNWDLSRFVYAGSCFEYGAGKRLAESARLKPGSIYAATKSAASLLVQTYGQNFGLPVVILRPFTPYGPWEADRRLVPYVIQAALRNAEMCLTSGVQTRDFVYVEDVVEAFLTAAVHPRATNGVFNVCSGKATSVREIVTAVLKLTGSSSRVQFGAIPHRPTELWTMSGDHRHTKNRLGWSAATSLAEGLRKTICWFQSRIKRT